MSYILEALKKADRERTLGEVPDLDTAHWGERRRQRSYRWVWVVMALLVVNGALLVVLLGRSNDAGVESQGRASGIADELPVTPVPRAEKSALQPSRNITRPREPVYVPPAVPKTPAVPVRRSQAAAVPAPPVYYGQTPVSTPTPAVVPAGLSGMPNWDDLSLEFRSSLTLPHIDVYVYDDDPARRFILVDLQKYREGETLQSGAVIEGIYEGSLQLNYQGTRFLVDR